MNEQLVNKGWWEEDPFDFDDFTYIEQKYSAVSHRGDIADGEES